MKDRVRSRFGDKRLASRGECRGDRRDGERSAGRGGARPRRSPGRRSGAAHPAEARHKARQAAARRNADATCRPRSQQPPPARLSPCSPAHPPPPARCAPAAPDPARARPCAVLRRPARLSNSPRSDAVNSIPTAGLPTMDHIPKNVEHDLTNFTIKTLDTDLPHRKSRSRATRGPSAGGMG